MKNQANATQFFYQNGNLITVNQGEQQCAIFRTGEVTLAERNTHLAAGTALLSTDQSGSVLSECREADTGTLVYTAYGHDVANANARSIVKFNGQHPTGDGHYLLGNGYRLYKPNLMRFYSPDSLSPFEKGGINAYAYCSGDPVNNADPSGHFGIPHFFRRLSSASVTENSTNRITDYREIIAQAKRFAYDPLGDNNPVKPGMLARYEHANKIIKNAQKHIAKHEDRLNLLDAPQPPSKTIYTVISNNFDANRPTPAAPLAKTSKVQPLSRKERNSRASGLTMNEQAFYDSRAPLQAPTDIFYKTRRKELNTTVEALRSSTTQTPAPPNMGL